ncbi:Flp family type IVb pilin [Chromohalobacter sp. 296-RDG]|uniref:Flp family type IVb pilin n=1 Tax=Chromohalobacter sp. 296-RDG TaxID=2994062 RepID=UPI00246932CB|nr:Flp family type IVb pilin [Chromohalobacter sp. 296-RDG]
MRISLIDKFTTLTQRIAAQGHATKAVNQARFKRQQGATAIEYAIIAGTIAIIIFAVFGTDDSSGLGQIFDNIFTDIKAKLNQ